MFFYVVTTPENLPIWSTSGKTEFDSEFKAKAEYGVNLWEAMKTKGYKIERFQAQKV